MELLGAPVGGLVITDAGASVFSLDVSVSGMDTIEFKNGLRATAMNQAIVVTLAAGGLGLIGKLNVEYHDENH